MENKNNKKEYWIKITMEDYGLILIAYFLAVFHLATEYPEPKRGRDSDWKKEKRKENHKIAKQLNNSHRRFLKTCRETMKDVLD